MGVLKASLLRMMAFSALLHICSCLFPLYAGAQNADSDFESTLAQRYDWIAYLDIETLPYYFRYQGSTLNPIDRVRVTYQQTPAPFLLRNLEVPPLQSIKYEDLWYHAGRAYGLSRLVKTPTQTNDQVVVFLRSPANTSSSSIQDAAVNCTMHLLAETSLNQSIVAAVAVPQSNFENISSKFEKFHFYPMSLPFTGRSGALSFQLISYPDGQERDLYYDQMRQ
jgi:hypothetical protein